MNVFLQSFVRRQESQLEVFAAASHHCPKGLVFCYIRVNLALEDRGVGFYHSQFVKPNRR